MNTSPTINIPVYPFNKTEPCSPTKREYVKFMLDFNNLCLTLQAVIDDVKSDAYGPELLPCETALEESRLSCIELMLDQYASLHNCFDKGAGPML